MMDQKRRGIRPAPQNYDVSNADFVRIWEAAENVAEVEEKTGVPKDVASAKASKLRSMGVPLKQMKKGRKGRDEVDVAELNALIADIRGGEAPPPASPRGSPPPTEEEIKAAEQRRKKQVDDIIARVLGNRVLSL
jgi:hypothetical protein